MDRFKNVLFDLDGTISDSFEGMAASVRHATKCMGLSAPTEDTLRAAVGPPLRLTFAKLLGTEDVSRIEEAMRLYRERYSVTGLFENHVYPGVPDLLADLNRAGFRTFIATSKPGVFAQRIIDHFGLSQYFAGVYGSELNGERENKRDLLQFLLDKESLKSGETAMVGDRSHDMLAAKAHRVCAVGTTWGYGSRSELEDAGADVLCASPRDVFRFLTQS